MLDSNSSLTVATTAVAGAIVVGYYYAKKKSDSQRPPLVPYTIPWLGSAITLGKDPDAFFKDSREKYGDIFTVQAAGTRLTYVTSAAATLAIYRNSKSLVFTPTRLEMSMKMFDMPRSILYDNNYMRETLYPLHHRILASANVAPMVDALVKYTVDIVKELCSQITGNHWSTTLKEFSHKPIFRAIAASMFGLQFPAGKDGASELITAVVYGARNESQPPWTDREIASAINSDFWAADGNMSWSFYWCINLMLHEPRGLAPLYEEIDAARDSWLKAHPNADLSGENLKELTEFLNNASFPLTASVVSETLRVAVSSFSTRMVVEDGVTINGYPQFEFRKGDTILCQLRSIHLDQETWGEDAAVFKPDRFIDSGITAESGSRKPFLVFGGGVSKCDGRHFAAKGCKFALALFLMNFDIKLDPAYEAPSSASSLIDMTRLGAGVMHPTKPTHVVVSKRS
ncbi:hypothetical protein FRC01_000967 [Tulasnella sp. 417]|nr:hypothetical protein FRC01_000967 [Tulasnella sp. 417]